MSQANYDARLRRIEAAHERTADAAGWPTLADWRERRTLSAADALRRWPGAWPVIEARRAAAREAEALAGCSAPE